ncbi:MAG TPA: RNA polymerase factor sigma-54 [Gemmatimonadales bacterium]
MKPGLHQSAQLRQELRMNPRLYQAMDLLYMPLLDLQQHLKQELLVNPFLELVEPEEETAPAEPTDEEREREAQEKQDEMDWEEILLDGFQVSGSGARDLSTSDETFERMPVQARALTDHLRDQLQMLELTDRQRVLAEEFLGNLGEDGYLQATLEEIVRGANRWAGFEVEEAGADGTDEAAPVPADLLSTAPGAAVAVEAPSEEADPAVTPFTVAEAEVLLRIMQNLDPPGICARDLRESLLIQLREFGEADRFVYRLVDEAFEDLKGHRWTEIAKQYNVDPKEVQDAADELARLDPKPGLRFLPADDEYVVPDLVAEKIEGEYRVFLNDQGMPRLRISKVYQDLAGDKKQFTGETREFITEKLNGATWLIQAIEQRRQTMLKVMRFIVDRQRDFFEKGIEYLHPLTLREVADVVSMHESTVSRVTNQKYVQTPRGVFPLKFFFSSSLETTSGEDASARAVRAQIQKLVGDETPSTPLTDAQIVSALRDRGIRIARRTVAKYRDQLGILPARMRKRL